jgi:hypothetical protein
MSYYILPKNHNNNLIINPLLSINNNLKVYLSFSLFNYYNESKKQIINICLNENELPFYTFENIIKIVNPYEYIFSKVPGSKFSVSKLKIKTNLFYDFLEIITTLNLFDNFKNKKMTSLYITENYDDTIYCNELLRENSENEISFFENINDNNLNNMINKYDFIFFESKYTNMNAYFIQLIKITMIILKNQQEEGISVIKLDEIFYKPVVDILFLLSSLFDKVYIIKPNTSNITSFDKYVVCKNFIYDNNRCESYKLYYLKLQYLINKIENDNIHSILSNEIPYYFMNKLDDMNIIIGQQQLEYLDQLINIFKNKNKEEKIEIIKKSNIQRSVNWCEKYKIPCNKFTEKTNIFLPIIKEVKYNGRSDSENIEEELNNELLL